MSDSSSVSSGNVSEDTMDFTGEILKNRYVIIKKLGKGSYATVWLAYDVIDNKMFAIKIQNPDDFEEGEDEIKLFNKLKSTKCKYFNTLRENFIHKDGEDEYICMVSDLYAGSLYDISKQGVYYDGYPYEFVKETIFQLMMAIDVLHNKLKILHTDIKPDNILIVGLNTKLIQLIKDIRDFGFNSRLKKNKQRSRKKKSNKSPLKYTIRQLMERLQPLIDNDSDSETSSSSSDSTSSEEESEDELNLIDEKFIKNPQIRLSDFGNCIDLNKLTDEEIQTRYYRAPEIILHCNYNEKSDIWAIGCTMYELLTGSILFDPDKKIGFSRNRQHLYDMQYVLGRIPSSLIKRSSKKDVFYRKNGLMKGINKVDYVPLPLFLKSKLNHIFNEVNDEFKLLVDWFDNVLKIEPNERFNIKHCLEHELFKEQYKRYFN